MPIPGDLGGGDPVGLPIGYDTPIYRQDKDKMPDLVIENKTAGVQYLCWRYVFKGRELWKICRITTVCSVATNGDIISSQIIEYPFGYATYNFAIADIGGYAYSYQSF